MHVYGEPGGGEGGGGETHTQTQICQLVGYN